MRILILSATTVCLLLVGLFTFSSISSKKIYEKRYFEILGAKRVGYLYKNMIRDFGLPVNLTYSDDGGYVYANYDGFTMGFFSAIDDAHLCAVFVTGEQYRFGKNSVGVGSTKDDVMRTYSKISRSADEDYAYIDGGIYIKFYFDELDTVERLDFFDYTHF